VRVGHRAAPVLALRVLVVHAGVERPGPVERDERHQILEAVRREDLDQLAHARRLHLEHARRVGAPEHLVHGRVIERDVIDVQIDVSAA